MVAIGPLQVQGWCRLRPDGAILDGDHCHGRGGRWEGHKDPATRSYDNKKDGCAGGAEGAMAGRLLVTDFDGTLTRRDFFQLVVEAFAPEHLEVYWRGYRDGRLTH